MAITELVCEVLGGIVAGALVARQIARAFRWAYRVVELLESIDDQLCAHTRELRTLDSRVVVLERTAS